MQRYLLNSRANLAQFVKQLSFHGRIGLSLYQSKRKCVQIIDKP